MGNSIKIIFNASTLVSASLRSDYALREIHEGICGSRIEGKILAYKVLRQEFYSPTM